MQFTLQALLDRLASQHQELIQAMADPKSLSQTYPISGARALNLADAHDMVFCKSERPDLLEALTASPARVVVTLPEIASLLEPGYKAERILVLTRSPRLLMALLLEPFIQPSSLTTQSQAIHPDAVVDPSARLGPGVVLGADVQISADCAIGANTVIDHATIGPGTWIGANCSIGGDGFGYEIDQATSQVVKIPHFGKVEIGASVEISSNVCIDRGSFSNTILQDEVKVDNLVHIAHNCLIKRGAFVIANAMVAGSATVGEYAWVAPSTSLINGMTMGRCAMTGLGAVAVKDIPDNMIAIGVPARPLKQRFPEDSELL